MSDSDEATALSSESIEALHEFYKEEHQKILNSHFSKSKAEFKENWVDATVITEM